MVYHRRPPGRLLLTLWLLLHSVRPVTFPERDDNTGTAFGVTHVSEEDHKPHQRRTPGSRQTTAHEELVTCPCRNFQQHTVSHSRN
jgi:hypothetical protein